VLLCYYKQNKPLCFPFLEYCQFGRIWSTKNTRYRVIWESYAVLSQGNKKILRYENLRQTESK